MHILLVEDDSAITMGLDYTLKKEGYAVCICMSVEQARAALSKQRFDLALIDLSLPDGSGFDLCDPARAQGAAVIFLTASDDEMCVVKGLDMGGDDYVTKPFRLQELLSRIRSVLRRRQDRQDDIIRIRELRVDLRQAKVFRNGQEVYLSAMEYQLFLFFLHHPGQILTRAQLLDALWDNKGQYVEDNTLSVTMKRLREKIEADPQNPVLITTAWSRCVNHRDIRRWMLFILALCLLITAILLLIAPQLVLPFLLSALLWNAVSAALIHLVNRRIRTLSDQLMRVYSNSLHTDIRDNEEGALSILRNDIYKITRTFHEQQKQSEKDRIFLSDTISDISHQLRTPLTSMRMMNELLQQDLPEAQRQEFFSCVNQQLDRLEWLVSSLLKLARMDACAITFQPAQVTLQQLVLSALEPLTTMIQDKQIQIDMDVGSIQVRTDPGWSSEALLNILKNAAEHTPVNGTIRIRARQTPVHTALQITDSGPGMNREELAHVFERFYRGKHAKDNSVGIGMAMAQSILRAQHGDIRADSQPGSGASFTVLFQASDT